MSILIHKRACHGCKIQIEVTNLLRKYCPKCVEKRKEDYEEKKRIKQRKYDHPIITNCEECNLVISSKDARKRFCDPKCRTKNYRKAQKELEVFRINKEIQQLQTKIWQQVNREKQLAYMRKWRKKNAS